MHGDAVLRALYHVYKSLAQDVIYGLIQSVYNPALVVQGIVGAVDILGYPFAACRIYLPKVPAGKAHQYAPFVVDGEGDASLKLGKSLWGILPYHSHTKVHISFGETSAVGYIAVA